MLYEIIQRDIYGYYVYEKEVYNVIDILRLNPRSSPDILSDVFNFMPCIPGYTRG